MCARVRINVHDPGEGYGRPSSSGVEETTENCDSLPNTPASPMVSNAITSWVYIKGENAYLKAASDAYSNDEVVRCQDVPPTYIIAARKQFQRQKGIVADEGSDAARVVADLLDIPRDEVIVVDSEITADCEDVTSFWTLPLAMAEPGRCQKMQWASPLQIRTIRRV